MRTVRRLLFPTLTVCAACLLGGCGPKMVSIKGKVTYKNQPVTGGRIIVTSTGGTSKDPYVAGEIDENGNFDLSKVPAGEVVITIDNTDLKESNTGPIGGSATYNPGAKAGGGPPGAGGRAAGPGSPPPGQIENMMKEKGINQQAANKPKGKYMEIPAKYRTQATSDLKFTLKGGEDLTLELKD